MPIRKVEDYSDLNEEEKKDLKDLTDLDKFSKHDRLLLASLIVRKDFKGFGRRAIEKILNKEIKKVEKMSSEKKKKKGLFY